MTPTDLDRQQAIAEFERSLPPKDVLLAWAKSNPPPQSWFDEDDDIV